MSSLLQRTLALLAICLCASAASALDYITTSFEDAMPPAGWSLMSFGSNGNWSRTTMMSNSGVWSARVFRSSGTQDEWLVTPAMDLSSSPGCFLEFYEAQSYWSGSGGQHSIMVSTTVPDDAAAFSPVVVWTPTNHDIPSEYGDPTELSLSAYVGNSTVYVAFRYVGSLDDTWLIDDVRIYEPNAHDVAALSISPSGHADPGVPMTPQGVVKNVGTNVETFDVLYEIFEGATPVYSEIASASGLAPDAETTVTFPAFTPVGDVVYTTVMTTQLAGDMDTSNDVVTGGFDAYVLGHVPMVFLFTNSGCVPCVPANQAWDAYMPTAGNTVALMRIHAWWPNGGDIMYLANPAQSQAYISEFGVSGVPSLWLDGLTGFGTSGPASVAAADAARFDASPMSVTPVFWNGETEELTVEIQVDEALPDSDYRLVCCITEDNILHNGGNGEPIHMQAFRRAYPGIAGTPIDVTPGLHTYTVSMPQESWVYENLRATVYVQDRGSAAFRDIIESGTNFLSNIEDLTAVDDAPVADAGQRIRIENNYPNPFNPKTSIRFSVAETGTVRLRVFDLQGRLVDSIFEGVQEAGSHSVDWDAAGQSSGIYFVQIQGAGASHSKKIVLTK